MNVTFCCPRCDQSARLSVEAGAAEIECPHCGQAIRIPPGAFDGETLTRCLVCPSTDLFVRKDFPQRLGVGLVALGIVGSSIAWGLQFAAVDLWNPVRHGAGRRRFVSDRARGLDVLSLPGPVSMVPGQERHGAFNLETHERHRQQVARMAGTQALSSWIKNANESKTTCAGWSKATSIATTSSCNSTPATPASFEIRPLAVVRPRSLADVVATVRYAAENKLPIHPRGAGTGLAGESLGRGIVLDFSRYMRRIQETAPTAVRIQPGVVHARLNDHLGSMGRQFGPDPAMSPVTTMGSVLAIDAGGSHWLKYGSARRHVQSLQLVLADGQVIEAGRESLSGEHFDSQSRTRPPGRRSWPS